MWCKWLDVDEQAKREIKDLLVSFDRSLIAAGSFYAVGFIVRSSSLRAQEVRRSICSCSLPEVLPINVGLFSSFGWKQWKCFCELFVSLNFSLLIIIDESPLH